MKPVELWCAEPPEWARMGSTEWMIDNLPSRLEALALKGVVYAGAEALGLLLRLPWASPCWQARENFSMHAVRFRYLRDHLAFLIFLSDELPANCVQAGEHCLFIAPTQEIFDHWRTKPPELPEAQPDLPE